ncbi:MAG TPA: GNAT family N-acetyltransferase [Victivallales bacterium]|nr:GNAT family N-acetyltransferase [Victivallales bacterium]
MHKHNIITDPEKIDKKAWSEFVANHPAGNIFQTPEYFYFCNSVPNCTAICIFYLIDDRIEGLLIGEIQRNFSGLLGFLTSRAIVRGGPVVRDNQKEIFNILLETFNSLIGRKVIFSQFRNLINLNFWDNEFVKLGYRYEDHLDIHIDLTVNENNLWLNINSTRRKQIRRSEKRGVKTRLIEEFNANIVSICYKILKETYSRAGLPLPGELYFVKAMEVLGSKQYLKLFVAELSSQIIGFRMVLCYRGVIYDWYAASIRKHFDKYPNDILPWSIIRWGKANKYTLFDFGGAGKPDKPYGVRDYKLKFGGEIVNYGRYTKVFRKNIYYFIIKMLELRQKFSDKK